MKKKAKEPEIVFGILVDRELIDTFSTFEEAEEKARDKKAGDETSAVLVLQINKAWLLDFPEDPEPELFGIGLDEL